MNARGPMNRGRTPAELADWAAGLDATEDRTVGNTADTTDSLDWALANQRFLTAEFALLAARLGTPEPDAGPAPVAMAEALAAARAAMPQPAAIDQITAVFGLSGFERQVLLLLAGVAMDSCLARLVPRPSFSVALSVFPGAHWSALAPLAPLRAWRLVELDETERAGAPGPANARLRLDERILHHLAGVNQLDARLAPLLQAQAPPTLMAPGHAAQTDRLALLLRACAARLSEGHSAGRSVGSSVGRSVGRSADHSANPARPAVLLLHGQDADGRRDVAAAVATRCGLELFALALADIPAAAAEQEALAVLWQREAALLPAALLIDAEENGPRPAEGDPATAGGAAASGATFVRRVMGPGRLVMVSARDPLSVPALAQALIDKPDAADQRALWHAALQAAGADASPALHAQVQQVSSQFRLGAAAIQRQAHALARPYPAEPDAGAQTDVDADAGAEAANVDLWLACRDLARPRLDELARRVQPRATWCDLVLPPPQLAALRQLVAQVRQRQRVHEDWGFAAQASGPRGLGISALFCGDSGVGKTLASEVLALELGLDLYRIDLSGVVSKYIGETEKNLRRVFDAAEDGGALLLFDEADAIFGKRSEVKDSHDRYANLEVSYLLQRMEAYRGLAVLTTNQRAALDPAFMRRLRFVVQFPLPDAAQRELLWRGAFPCATPRQGLDTAALARLQLSGGQIRNIALSAAFMAADAGSPVRMDHVTLAARQEVGKQERTLPEAQLQGLARGQA